MKSFLEIIAVSNDGRKLSIILKSDQLVSKYCNTIFIEEFDRRDFLVALLNNYENSSDPWLSKSQYYKLNSFLKLLDNMYYKYTIYINKFL